MKDSQRQAEDRLHGIMRIAYGSGSDQESSSDDDTGVEGA